VFVTELGQAATCLSTLISRSPKWATTSDWTILICSEHLEGASCHLYLSLICGYVTEIVWETPIQKSYILTLTSLSCLHIDFLETNLCRFITSGLILSPKIKHIIASVSILDFRLKATLTALDLSCLCFYEPFNRPAQELLKIWNSCVKTVQFSVVYGQKSSLMSCWTNTWWGFEPRLYV